jgi:hypothetical protein
MRRPVDTSLYTEDEARIMDLAFKAAWDRLLASDSVHAQPAHAERTRELLALKVIELLRRGAPDVQRLCDEALRELRLLAPCGQNSPPDGGTSERDCRA